MSLMLQEYGLNYYAIEEYIFDTHHLGVAYVRSQVCVLHRQLAGIDAVQSMRMYLLRCQQVEEYGAHTYKVYKVLDKSSFQLYSNQSNSVFQKLTSSFLILLPFRCIRYTMLKSFVILGRQAKISSQKKVKISVFVITEKNLVLTAHV